MSLSLTAQKALTAYGGEDRWQKASAVEAVVSASGLLFWMKGHRPFRRLSIQMEIQRSRVRFRPIDRSGNTAVLEGQTVRIEDSRDRVLQERPEARRFFAKGRRLFYWDNLDHAYFSGYALWNYLTFPALLIRKDIRWQEPSPGTLTAQFPPEIPTHCPEQQFFFDSSTGLLKQHNYTAEVVGPWAKAAHVVLEHSCWEGLPFPSKRRVTPRKPDGSPRPFPTLVAITVHEWRLS